MSSAIKKTSEARNRTSLEMKCGQCIHFKTGPKHYEELCSNLGIKPSASTCDAFFPDVNQLREVESDVMVLLGKLHEKLSVGQSKILAMTLARPEWLNKADVKWMQEVVFCFGQDYLCNYARGFVIGVSKDGSQVFLSSSLEKLNRKNKKESQLTARMMRDSILTLDEFARHKQDLIRDGRVVEPARTGLKVSTFQKLTFTKKERAAYEKLLNTKPDDYVPPTLDSVPDSWRDKRALTKVSDPLAKKGKLKGTGKGSTSIKVKRG